MLGETEIRIAIEAADSKIRSLSEEIASKRVAPDMEQGYRAGLKWWQDYRDSLQEQISGEVAAKGIGIVGQLGGILKDKKR